MRCVSNSLLNNGRIMTLKVSTPGTFGTHDRTPTTSVLPAFCAVASDCMRGRFIKAGLHHDHHKWSLWSDSHRRIRVYKTHPVAAEAQRRWEMTKDESPESRARTFC